MKYQLYVVTNSGGFYPALTATPPTDSFKDVSDLEEIVKRLRPGYGKIYVTVVTKHGDDGNLNEEDSDFMRKEAALLMELTTY